YLTLRPVLWLRSRHGKPKLTAASGEPPARKAPGAGAVSEAIGRSGRHHAPGRLRPGGQPVLAGHFGGAAIGARAALPGGGSLQSPTGRRARRRRVARSAAARRRGRAG